jgi:hypothetical protein
MNCNHIADHAYRSIIIIRVRAVERCEDLYVRVTLGGQKNLLAFWGRESVRSSHVS